VEAVHDARTSIKRIRTVIRLGRGQLGERRYHVENDALGAVSQQLASLRDAMIMPTVLKGLLNDDCGAVDADEITHLRARLAARGDAVHGDAAEKSIGAALADLRAVRERVDDWPLTREEAPLKPVLDGFQRAYSRAQESYRQAHDHPDTETLHAWRKRVKDVRYGAELLRDADPSQLKQIRREARKLSGLLGDDHDLAVLAQLASDFPSTSRLIDRRRQDLQRSAFALAEGLFARRPRKVATRIRRRARKRTAW
jgi:CHAD domain-containing protein